MRRVFISGPFRSPNPQQMAAHVLTAQAAAVALGRYVSPSEAESDSPNGVVARANRPSDSQDRLARVEPGPDDYDFCGRKTSPRVPHSTRRPALGDHIARVGLHVSNKEVSRVDARRVIARVAQEIGLFEFGSWIRKEKREPVRLNGLSLSPEGSVAPSEFATGPHPATVGLFLNLLPKPVLARGGFRARSHVLGEALVGAQKGASTGPRSKRSGALSAGSLNQGVFCHA